MTMFSSPWRSTALSLVVAALPFSVLYAAETPKPQGLMSTVEAKTENHIPPGHAINGNSRSVKIHHEQLRGARFFVDLPDGVSFEAVRDSEYDLGKGNFAWVGHAEGNSRDRVIIGTSGKAMAATFSVGDRLFKIEPRADGSHVVSEVAASDPAPELDPITVEDFVTSGKADFDSNIALELDADAAPVIDVLVAYTPAVAAKYGAEGAEALVIQAVAETNQAYANSGIFTRLNLVRAVMTDYVESGNMNTDLSRLRATTDGYMDELHALRDMYSADLVSLIEEEPKYCGIAYRMATLTPGFASSAFSVVHSSCATGYYSFAHELGHNQGANHDAANANSAIFPFAFGYQDPFSTFRTVMAYNCISNCQRVGYFSNSTTLYNGQPAGIPNYADNALALNYTAATVSSFRTGMVQPKPPVEPRDLNAIATGPNAISLSWTDNSSDESGFKIERSVDSTNFTEIAPLPANSTTYLDNDLEPDTLYTYRAKAWNSIGYSAYSGVALAATDTAVSYVEQLATADKYIQGTRSGTYKATWYEDRAYETITEEQHTRNNGKQISRLFQKWSFNVVSGKSMVFIANAHTNATSDSFTFSYSTGQGQWVSMFTVNSNSPEQMQFNLPPEISGNVFIRVKDNVRDVNQATSHSVKVDYMMIRTETGEPSKLFRVGSDQPSIEEEDEAE